MPTSPLAGKPAPAGLLIDPARLEREYYDRRPDVDDTDQLVSFGTSGHRGSPARGTFTESHVLAIAQAVCDYRRGRGIDGPLFMGKDTHGLSGPAQRTALEVLAANGVRAVVQRDDGPTPTPAVSRAILAHNRGGTDHLADGIIITPSHNPPADGGLKYNPPDGGPGAFSTHLALAAPLLVALVWNPPWGFRRSAYDQPELALCASRSVTSRARAAATGSR